MTVIAAAAAHTTAATLATMAPGPTPTSCSSRLTALDTVALDSVSSAEAAANDRNSTTFAKIANASKSGSFATAIAHFWKQCVSIVSIYNRNANAYPELQGNSNRRAASRHQIEGALR